jgi:hypothetical protein
MGRHGGLLKNEQDVHLFERLTFRDLNLSGLPPCL